MEEIRVGKQTPTKSYVIPYEDTLGDHAIEKYNETGRNCTGMARTVVI